MKRRVLTGLFCVATALAPTVGGCSSSPDAEQPTEPTATEGDENAEALTSSSSACSTICTGGGLVGCNYLSGIAGLACGFGSWAICSDACSGDMRRCTNLPGGRACMTRARLWWCDQKVDGRKVTAQYELDGRYPPGIVETSPAPSRACSDVRWPSWEVARRFRICIQGEGCGAWIEHP